MDLSAEQIELIVTNILQIIGAFSVGAAFIPRKVAPYLPIVRKVIDFAAFNIKNAKNKDD